MRPGDRASDRLGSVAGSARELESKALRLSAKERARLAERLISSLEGLSDPEADALWLEEAERRLDELESGESALVPADEVFRESRHKLR